jgi:hypothetical protein
MAIGKMIFGFGALIFDFGNVGKERHNISWI